MSAAALAPAGATVTADETARDGMPIVGREAELERVRGWLGRPGPSLLEIEGEAGIGKSVLWHEAVRRAREEGMLVLVCRPVEVETAVSYGALATLFEPALEQAHGDVALPRRRALERALRLRDVGPSSLDETAVALGAVSVLRAVARDGPVVVAVEDVQWLDASSRVALTYALRSLQTGDDARVLLTRRLGEGTPLELGGAPLSLAAQLLRPGPLSAGALHRLIAGRLGTSLSRPRLVRLHAASRGNPLHALELARFAGESESGEAPFAIPPSLGEALRLRIDALSPAAQELLLAVAVAGDPGLDLLSRVVDPSCAVGASLVEAIEAGVLVVSGGGVRFAHPLLASTVYADADTVDRRRLHLRLAELAASAETRARHLALGSGGRPDEPVAAALEDAAAAACRRGARGTGAALYEQAASLTPPRCAALRIRRAAAAARAHFESGDAERARTLLEEAARQPGEGRFEALCALGTLLDETAGGEASLSVFEQVLASDDPALRAKASRGLAQALGYVGDLDRALAHADAAVEQAEQVTDRVILVAALAMQALLRKMSGRTDWRTPLDRGLVLEAELDLPDLDGCPSAFAADTLRFELALDDARAAYERMLERTCERGDVRTECWCRFGLASVELAAGRWESADEHAGELRDLTEQTGTFRLPALRTSAHLAVVRGDVTQARALLDRVIAQAEPAGELHNLRSALQLDGLLALSLGDAEGALGPLRRAREIAERMAVGEPSMLTFLLDEVEAHSLVGDAASATAVLMTFDRRCEAERLPWMEPLGLRARGLTEVALGDLEAARSTLESAVAVEDALPLPLDRARTRLALGRVLRRLQHRSRARDELEHAQSLFVGLGAGLWAERAREELARIGGRSASGDRLTPTEQRVAELVADGLSNKEVAVALFVTAKTVESTLTRIYRKLGIRSRTELALLLAGGSA